MKRAAKSRDADTRLAAEEALGITKWTARQEKALCKEIRELTGISGGMTRALLLAEEHPGEAVKKALLETAAKPNEAAMHCAALACYLAGVAKEAFDWDMRPFFLRFHVENDEADRKKAYAELLEKVKGPTKPTWAEKKR